MADELTLEQLRAMAQEADARAGASQSQDEDAQAPEPAQPEDQKPAKHDTGADTQTAPDSEKEPSPDQPQQAKQGDRKEKETQRLEKTWQAVNAEKEKLAAERAELERLRAEAQQQTQQPQPQQSQGIRDNTGRTAADYKDAAKMLREEGEESLAELADKKAAELEQAEHQAAQQQSMEQVKAAWMDSVNKTLATKPELADPNHELSKAVQALIQSNPGFVHLPNGFALAAEVAESKLAAGRVAALESEAKELRKQLETERKKLAPAGGGASFGQPGAKNLDQLPANRRKAELLALAAQLDSQT
jgi:fused signal recognition particle receptor